MKQYLCKHCDFKTVTVSNIKIHIKKVHLKIKPYACHICTKRYNTPGGLEDHLNSHQGYKRYECDLCLCKFGSKQAAKTHIQNYHQNVEKVKKKKKNLTIFINKCNNRFILFFYFYQNFRCHTCGKIFLRKNQLQTHNMIHTKSQRIKCHFCNVYLSNEDTLQRHVENLHQQDYMCNVCNKIFKSKKQLNNHMTVSFIIFKKKIFNSRF